MNVEAAAQFDKHDPDYRNVQHSIEWVAEHSPNPDDCYSCGDQVEGGSGAVDRWGDLYCDDCR